MPVRPYIIRLGKDAKEPKTEGKKAQSGDDVSGCGMLHYWPMGVYGFRAYTIIFVPKLT